MSTRPISLIVMGVSGSGKTTVAQALAAQGNLVFAEADSFHSRERIEMMSAGVALNDDDRWPWLEAIRTWIDEQAASGHNTIVSCSALKRSYRDLLKRAEADVNFVWLDPPVDVVGRRLAERTGHFMPASLLESQLEALEALDEDELLDGALVFSGMQTVEEIVSSTLASASIKAALEPRNVSQDGHRFERLLD